MSTNEIFEYPSGAKYIGDMLEDNFHGNGTFTYSNGDIYTGQFKNDCLEGYGKYIYKNSNNYYEGEFKNDCFNGIGIFYFDENNFYAGRFKDDLMIGKIINKEYDKVYECIFQNDKLIKYEEIFYSNIDNPQKYIKLGIKDANKLFDKVIKEI